MSGPECPLSDPEKVWEYVQQLQRPYPRPSVMRPILVYIPGWGTRGEEVKYAYITSASIKRTHVTDGTDQFFTPGTVKAVRATITLALKEAVFFSRAAEAKDKGQTETGLEPEG
jgi:hypothetical protein